jgi:photosystem II stability/assembly factor-like uncharacterized protein
MRLSIRYPPAANNNARRVIAALALPYNSPRVSRQNLSSYKEGGMSRHLLVLSLLVVATTAATADDWQFIGPKNFGARVISLAVDPKNPNHVFAGSASGGLWEKKDASSNWSYVNTSFPVLGVGAIAIHPRDSSVIYIGTGEVYGHGRTTSRGFDVQNSRGQYGIGILRTVDGGKTWTKSLDWKASDRTGVQDLAIVPNGEGFTVWAATSEGVYRLDSSKTAEKDSWTKSLAVVAATSLSVHPQRPDELVAVCGNFASTGNGIYKTKDGGKTWRRIANGTPATFGGKGEIARAPSRPDTLYATLGNLNTLTFSSAGVMFDANGNYVPGKTDPNNLYKCFYVPGTTGPSGWTLKSTDAGETWQTQLTEQDLGNTQGWYARALAVDATNPSSLFMGYMVPYRSFDGGKNQINSWVPARFVMQAVYDQANPSLIFVDFHSIVLAPSNPDILYYACDQGVYRSTDRGLSAVRFNDGLDLMQFYRGSAMSQKDPNFIAGNPQDYGPGFMHYLGAGKWRIEIGYGYEVGFAALDDTNDILFLGHHTNTTLSRWQNGATPQPDPQYTACYIPDVNPFDRSTNCLDNASYNSPIVSAPSNPNVLYAARDVLYKSVRIADHTWASDDKQGCTNNFAPGVTWAPTNDGEGLDGNPIFTVAISRKDENNLILATSPRYKRMHVYATSDGGRTYRDLTNNLPGDALPMAIARDSNNENILYITLGGYGMPKVWRLDMSAPAPQSWENRGAGLPDVWASGLAVDPKDSRSLYVATDEGVFRSTDTGASWTKWSEGLYPGVMSIELQLAERYRLLRLFTHGNGVWERRLP